MLGFLRHRFRVAVARHHERKKLKKRSPAWRGVAAHHLHDNPLCAGCGGDVELQVHHVKPFHLHPELELDRNNLMTLCMGRPECHLWIGHGDGFRFYNPNVLADAAASLRDAARRPVVWVAARTARLT